MKKIFLATIAILSIAVAPAQKGSFKGYDYNSSKLHVYNLNLAGVESIKAIAKAFYK